MLLKIDECKNLVDTECVQWMKQCGMRESKGDKIDNKPFQLSNCSASESESRHSTQHSKLQFFIPFLTDSHHQLAFK